jgi:hypothetical protein
MVFPLTVAHASVVRINILMRDYSEPGDGQA